MADPESQATSKAPLSPDFICFCGQDWWYHNRAHSDFQLMLCMARSRRVLLVNSIGMRMPMPGKSSKVLQKVFRKVRSILKLMRRPLPDLPNLRVVSPVVFPAYGLPWLRGFAAWLVRAQVQAAAWLIGIRRPAILVTLPTAWDVVRRMDRACLIYNRSDKHSAFEEADREYISSLEQDLMKHADRVLYVSRILMKEEMALCSNPPYFLDHGVDLESFAAQVGEEPEDMRHIQHPRVGFFGSLRSSLVDLGLLEKLAQELPAVQLVLVGDAPSDVSGLVRLTNVHWLGFKNHDEIPQYGAGFDVALMPYRLGEWIRNCNPIKLKEYLALGLPVVSTDFPEAHRYGDAIQVASDDADFVEKVRTLVAEAMSGVRRNEASELNQLLSGCTWEKKAEEVLALVSRLCEDI